MANELVPTLAKVEQLIIDNAVEPRGYDTRAALLADLTPADGVIRVITNDPTPGYNGSYRKQGASGSGTWVQSSFDRVAQVEGRASVLERNMLTLVPGGKNLIDKTRIQRGVRYSPAAGTMISDTNARSTHRIPVTPGKTYIASGVGSGNRSASFWESETAPSAIGHVFNSTAPFTIPAGAHFVVIQTTDDGQDNTANDDTAQLEIGAVKTAYEPYISKVAAEDVAGLELKLSRAEILIESSFNKINPLDCDYARRYSVNSSSMVVDNIGLAASDYIPVDEGEWYTISGDALYADAGGAQGGYFAGEGHTNAVANISFVAPVSGSGWAFQVPTGQSITHVVISVWKAGRDPVATTLDGVAQLEEGEMATAYRPYALVETIRPELVPEGGGGGGSTPAVFDAEAWYRFVHGDEGQYLADRFPKFRRHWLNRDKDLVVVNTGTSLTARSTEHCTEHPQASARPPLMHSNNFASLLWDRLRWEGQQYRRYDADGFFTESGGAFSTSTNLAEWDDGAYRHGLTRYSGDTGASVQFVIPAGAWQFNFIYRTDSTGVDSVALSVAEGAGQLEVFDEGAGAWVEAHGYVFSMREPAPVARGIMVPRASDGVLVERTIPSKGNTTYQKRLKMRCKSAAIDSRASSKAVTVTGQTAGRFMYWGVEWSPREHMITYINAARGSHNTQAENTTGLPRYADNEVWGFKPDLLFFELPIHNDGAAAAGSYAGGIWERLTDDYVFRADYELSMASRAAHFGLSPELGMFTASIAWNFGGIEDDGTLKFGEQLDGAMMTALDKYNQAYAWVIDNHPEAVIINAAQRWVEAGVAIFGDLRSATEGSGKAGRTFTNEGSHWNDTGSRIMAKAVLPVFGFTL